MPQVGTVHLLLREPGEALFIVFFGNQVKRRFPLDVVVSEGPTVLKLFPSGMPSLSWILAFTLSVNHQRLNPQPKKNAHLLLQEIR
ncbi:hypothetical protein CDL15_Pgr008440 [Punica granatum]|uniref:Uncharacterized protein n=1 Tax=Punica granatum TaxID=22663 RepID=A0A218WNR5_PUNGR|nr:hypothetical protein CDL15_Pgr008440 [Punica granatum]PKI46295.1 hypothetical protein CRG98_033304 [Punica granatum]